MLKLDEILDLDLDKEDEDFPTILRVQASAVQTIMTTQTKVDEARLKQAREDRLPALLARVLAEEQKLMQAAAIPV